MKPAPFSYRRPETVEEAVALLDGDAKVLAGGQSLVPLLNMRLARPGTLVDVNRVAGLDGIGEQDGRVRIGALVRQSAAEAAELVRRRLPLLAEALPYVGHFVTRNRGTVGGSVAHADAAGELPLALAALGGSVVAASTRGRREVSAGELFVTHFTTTLEPDELVVETLWPAAPAGTGAAFEEFALRRGDYALAMAACTLRLDERAGAVAEAAVHVAAVADRPTRVDADLAGATEVAEAARAAGAAAAAQVDPADGLHASGAYRRHLTRVLVERAVARAWARAAGAPAA